MLSIFLPLNENTEHTVSLGWRVAVCAAVRCDTNDAHQNPMVCTRNTNNNFD